VIEIINNGESLTKAYNRGLKQATNDIVVFCHDDITIETNNWGPKLLKQFERHPEYGIMGVAGTKYLASSGQWWENKKKMYGRVAHTHEGNTWLSSYSDDLAHDIEETVIVDGVFFVVDKRKLKVDFNETVEGFHFYDVTFCLENYLQGVKVGVITTVRVNHKSIGMTNESWEANRLIFAEKFKDSLPINIKKVLRKGQKLKVLIGALNLRLDTPEGLYSFNLIKQLIADGCDVSVAANVEKKAGNLVKAMGVKIFTLQEPPGFKLGDGKWSLKTAQGDVLSQDKTLYKIKETNFDVIHMNQKPVSDHLIRLYPDTEIVCTIHSTDKTLEEPLRTPQIKKYIAINDEIKEVLVSGYGIDSDLVARMDDFLTINAEYKSVLT
jgi:hypothetical protein